MLGKVAEELRTTYPSSVWGAKQFHGCIRNEAKETCHGFVVLDQPRESLISISLRPRTSRVFMHIDWVAILLPAFYLSSTVFSFAPWMTNTCLPVAPRIPVGG